MGWGYFLSIKRGLLITIQIVIILYSTDMSSNRNPSKDKDRPRDKDDHERVIQQTISEDLNTPDQQQQMNERHSEGLNQCYESRQSSLPYNILLGVLQVMNKDKTYSEMGQNGDGTNHVNEDAMPEPLDSDEQQSNEAQYLSYIQNQMPHQSSNQQQNQQIQDQEQPSHLLRLRLPFPDRSEFLSILYQSAIYMRKEEKRTKIDDELLADRLNDHLIVSTCPQGKSEIGKALLANGYFLGAFAVLMARVNRSEVLFRFIMDNFYNTRDSIEDNLEDFLEYYNRPIDTFNLIDPQQLSSSTHRQNTPSLSLKRIKPPIDRQEEPVSQEQGQNNRNQNSKERLNRMKSTRATVNTVAEDGNN